MKILRTYRRFLSVLFLFLLVFQLTSCDLGGFSEDPAEKATEAPTLRVLDGFDPEHLPDYAGEPYVAVHGNIPYFEDDEKCTDGFEMYSDLDALGRCGEAYANLCLSLMPTDAREGISSVKPSGWQSVTYEFVSGKNLYNRCHLIGFQLAGENANKQNLITGTRYLNVDGMLPFENMVADYIKETENHVLYRVTPVYLGSDLVARGVLMEAFSVEDDGDGICFCVWCFNVQPGVVINYADGTSHAAGTDPLQTSAGTSRNGEEQDYVLNTSSKKFHLPSCSGAASISVSNREDYRGSRDDLLSLGYTPCGTCKP